MNFDGSYCFIFREKGFSEVCNLIEAAKDAKIRLLEVKNSNQDARIHQLEEEKSDLTNSLLRKIPECPVINKLILNLQANILMSLLGLF